MTSRHTAAAAAGTRLQRQWPGRGGRHRSSSSRYRAELTRRFQLAPLSAGDPSTPPTHLLNGQHSTVMNARRARWRVATSRPDSLRSVAFHLRRVSRLKHPAVCLYSSQIINLTANLSSRAKSVAASHHHMVTHSVSVCAHVCELNTSNTCLWPGFR